MLDQCAAVFVLIGNAVLWFWFGIMVGSDKIGRDD